MVSNEEWKLYIEKGERDKMLCKPCYDQIKDWGDEGAKRMKGNLSAIIKRKVIS
jgi:hypothetical protein